MANTFTYLNKEVKMICDCVIPENIHTPPTDGSSD